MTVFVSIAGFGAVFMVVFLTVLCRDQRCHSVSGARNLGNAFGVFGLPAGRRSHVVKLVALPSGNTRAVVVLRPRHLRPG
jgi:hypothetical protein